MFKNIHLMNDSSDEQQIQNVDNESDKYSNIENNKAMNYQQKEE